jgi:hypothetical protein
LHGINISPIFAPLKTKGHSSLAQLVRASDC